MSKLDHTLKTTLSGDGSKTITGCVVGEPLIFLYGNGSYTDQGCMISFSSGVAHTNQTNSGYKIGWNPTNYTGDGHPETRCQNIIAIPTATSVVVYINYANDDNKSDRVYVYA